ncbi:MAG: glycerol-3-phosphate 1-O-acyltransferase PlsY [Candidatus Syntrophosphaera sp.]
MNILLLWALLCVGAYLIGSIPFGYLAGRILHRRDIRSGGSGNIGATNALRQYGAKTGVIVLILDLLKGFAVAWLLYQVVPQRFPQILGVDQLDPFIYSLPALAVIVGHMHSVFLGFKGGKGVATAAGVFLYVAPWPLLLALAVFVIVAAASRYVSLASIIAAASLFVIHFIWNLGAGMQFPWLTLIVAILIILKHGQNIQRLVEKRENKLSFRSKGGS